MTTTTKRYRVDLWTYTAGPHDPCGWVPQVSVETLSMARGAADAVADPHVGSQSGLVAPAARWLDVHVPTTQPGIFGQARIVDTQKQAQR